MNPPVWSFRNWWRLQRCWLKVGPFSLLTGEAGLDVGLDILEQSGPVVRGGDLHISLEASVVASENAIMRFAQRFLLVLLGQEQSRPGVFVVGQTDPEDVILVVEGPFYQVIQVVGFSSETPAGH